VTTPIAVAFVNTIVTIVLHIDDNELYTPSVYLHLKRHQKRQKLEDSRSEPGCVFLEIDGLSEAVLREAIEKETMPFLAGLVKAGRHKIKGWETDLSSQTGASQAGILHGCNKDIPAFRWVEKSVGNKIVSSNGIGDASMIEKRITDGNGLLSINGGAVTNLFSGDSKDNIFVYSVLKNIRQLYSESWSGFYAVPFNLGRVIVLSLADIFPEIRSRYRQWRQNIQPRLHNRGLKYFFARIGANVSLREISTYILIGDIIAGEKDVVYSTYFGYDEIAHHCGVRDEESLSALKKIDQCISRIFAAQKYGERAYNICILSDHGQTNGATFKQRYGLSLDELIKKLLPKKENIYGEIDSNQDHFGQMIFAPIDTVNRKLNPKEKKQKEAHAIVLASGNLGLIYFTKWSHRMTLEEINAAYPNMIPGLIKHEGVGFIMVKSNDYGPLVLGAKGKYYLSIDKVEGDNPLAKFGKNAAQHVRRTDSFNYVPDILVMSQYDSERDEVAAFEELVGSHGGLGGNQSKPFIMYPSDWDLDFEEIIGAEQVYKVFKNFLENF
ncbi:MAG: alkaline phosphatase family protein, partial [Sulfuricurvum sp.]